MNRTLRMTPPDSRRAAQKRIFNPRPSWISLATSTSLCALFILAAGKLVIFHAAAKEPTLEFKPPPSVFSQPKTETQRPEVKMQNPLKHILSTAPKDSAALFGPEETGPADGPASGAFELDALRYTAPDIAACEALLEDDFSRVASDRLSTFSIDVDTASYANVRRCLKSGQLPPKEAVRIEEMINYFSYNYDPPEGVYDDDGATVPFAAHFAQATCPWNKQHKLVRIALKGREIAQDTRPPLNLVFLLDVSGSMQNANKLPLVKRSMEMLCDQLDDRDRVSIVVYAGASGLVLPPTSGADRNKILGAFKHLQAGGRTDGGQGIELAYKTALENVREKGISRVILCADGDFNTGIRQRDDLNRLIEEKAKSGIFLSVLGFGSGNDSTLESLADRGNGNYATIDTFSEARKVLVDQMSGTLVTIAKDVRIQVEFNPARVAGYRLIGYQNRILDTKQVNDDTRDAGEIGAGHTVTALYELVPAGLPVDPLTHQSPSNSRAASDELLTVNLRYKQPDSDTSRKLSFSLVEETRTFEQADEDFRFATAIAGFGMLLRDPELQDNLTSKQVFDWAKESLGSDEFGYRRECLGLIRDAAFLTQ